MPHVVLLVVVTCLLAACGAPSAPVEATRVGCASHLECFASERCVEGTCRPLPAGEALPVEEALADGAPVVEVPADPTPDDAPVDEAPADPAPGDEAPVEEAPVGDDPDPAPPAEEQADPEEDTAGEETAGDENVGEDPVEEAPVADPYDWTSDTCVPAATEATSVALPRLPSSSASLAVDVSGRFCDEGSRELFLQTEVFRGDPVFALLTYEGDHDLDLAFKNGLSSDYQGFGIGYGQTFEIGAVRAPQEGDADPLDTASFLKVRAFTSLPDTGVPFRLQVRSGLPCVSDAGCTGADACLRAYWSPRQDSLGTERRMRHAELTLPGACAAPLKPTCDAPDAADLEQLGNDRQSAAKVVTFNANGFAPNDGRACQFDEDWYRVTMPATGDVAIELWNTDGEMQPASFLVSAYDEAGRPLADMGYEAIAAGAKQDDLVVPARPAGSTLYVRIVSLTDSSDGAYYLDFDVEAGGCQSDAACAGDDNAARYGRTVCEAGACVFPSSGCF
jgi:hypothetical protein